MRRRRNAEACHAGREVEGWVALRSRSGSEAASAPAGASRGPSRGRGPGGCLPSPWSKANAAIFQLARVTSGSAGAGAGASVGVEWGQGRPTPAGPHVPAGHASGPRQGDPAAPRCCGGPAPCGFPCRRGWERLAVLVPSQRYLFVCTRGGLEPLRCAHPRQV